MFLKQSTAFTFRHGPFVSSSDGFTAQTALSLAQADFRLSKAGGAFAQKNDATAGTHDENGYYTCVLNTTDTATLGLLEVNVNKTGALPVFRSFIVLPAMIYDSLVAGTDRLDTNITHALDVAWGSGAITSAAIAANAIDANRAVHTGTAQAGAANSITLAAGASATNGLYDPSMVKIIGGTGVGQQRMIIDYNGTSKVAIVDRDWRTNPDNTSVYQILPETNLFAVNEGLAQGGAGTSITLNASASSVDNTYNGQLVVVRGGTGQDQVRLITGYVGSTKVATVDSAWATNPTSSSSYMVLHAGRSLLVSALADTINASALASDAVTEIQTGLSTLNAAGIRSAIGMSSANLDSQLTAIDDFIDTEIGALVTATGAAAIRTALGLASANLDTQIGTLATSSALTTISGKIDTIDDFVDTEVAAIKAVTDKLDTALELDGAVYRYTTNALEQAPAGGTGLDAAGVRAAIGLASANLDTQLGAIDDFLDTEIAAIKAKTDNLPSDPADASDIAALFVTVNTKLDTIDDFMDTEIAAIKAKTDNLPSDPADASDIAAAFAVTNGKIDVVDDLVDTEVAAIKTVVDAIKLSTDNLPSDPADASVVAGLIAAVSAKIDTVDDFLDTEIAAIKAKTDGLPSDPADASDIAAAFGTVNATLATIGGYVDTEIGTLITMVDALPTNAELATALAAADDAVLAAIAALNNLSASQVNAEVLDVLSVDTFTEPGQGNPAATASLATKLGFVYKAARNLHTQTNTTFSLYNDAGTTVDQKAAVSDDGTTFTRAKLVTGP